jgi:hypothetical protein
MKGKVEWKNRVKGTSFLSEADEDMKRERNDERMDKLKR